MNFFFLLTLALVSGFSIKAFEPKQLLKDPRSFIAAIANASPEIVQQLSDYAQQLIDEGETCRNNAISARDAANVAAADAAAELTAATAAQVKALAHKTDRQNILSDKTTLEAETRVAMDDAWTVQVESQQKFDEAQATMNTELARIAKEDADLKNVKVLLEELMPALIQQSFGRNLLSEENVDPTALQNVIDLVASLLQQGELDAAAFTKARDDAQDVLTAAINDHDAKKAEHTHALGAKQVATDLLADATHEEAVAKDVEAAALSKKNDADEFATAAEAHRDSEEARIDNERADFEKVIELLGTLGDKGGEEEAAEAAEE
jgi:hypothetical protein